jgi:UTP--glucose-1-phosphate uridylyltransferase
MMKITKAVFPVAGLGTRFLPATKANPKEMLPIVDKPLIQYAVEEAIKAGIRELIFVTNSTKRAIEDHFDSNFELEATLQGRGHDNLLTIVKNILPEGVSCAYIRQRSPLGLGHAIWCAKQLLMNEPFAILLADDLIDGEPFSCLEQMVQQFADIQTNIIAVETVAAQETKKYGIAETEAPSQRLSPVKGIVEKPAPAEARSNLGVVGRYILMPQIFSHLEKISCGSGGELQLTDAIASLLKEQSVYAYQFLGKRYDCGNKLGYLEATVAYALKHPELGVAFKHTLESIVA